MTSASTLERLAHALTGGSSPPPPTTPEPPSPSPARSDAPRGPIEEDGYPGSLLPPKPLIEGLPANPIRHRHEPLPLTAWFVDPENPAEPYPRTQSMRAWAQELGLQYATLRWRVEHGWPDMEALGLLPHTRNHAEEQRPAGNAGAGVLVIDNGTILSRAVVAERLGIKPASVAQLLRQYRTADGSQALVELSTLAARSRRRRND